MEQKFQLEYIVSRRGVSDGRTKDGKEFHLVSFRGSVIDSQGHSFDCDANSGFGFVEDFEAHDGDHVLLTVTSLDLRKAFPVVVFSGVSPIKKKA